MFKKLRTQLRPASPPGSVLTAIFLTLVLAQVSEGFPVDFILTAPEQRDAAEVAEAKEAPADAPKDAEAAAPAKKKPVKKKPGVVRKKAAVVAAGAAEAVEGVGQVFGDLIGGLLGGRNQAPQAKLDQNALKQFEARYGRHFDQMVRTELHFIRIVCQPTRQQYDALAKDGKFIRTKTVNKFALIQQGGNRGVRSSNDSDTRSPIAEGLLASAKRHLSAEQVAAYERELAAREEASKAVSVLVTAAKLDRRLVLNTQQRAQAVKVLDENWNSNWGSMQMMMYGGQYFPDIPDPKITPFLTATQKKILKTVTQQSQVHFGFNVGMNQGIVLAEEEWDDTPADEKSDKESPKADSTTEEVSTKEAAAVQEASE